MSGRIAVDTEAVEACLRAMAVRVARTLPVDPAPVARDELGALAKDLAQAHAAQVRAAAGARDQVDAISRAVVAAMAQHDAAETANAGGFR